MKKTKQFNFLKATEKWRLLLASDTVIFSLIDNQLQVFLVKRKFAPGGGKWAIPGGFVREDESLEASALRELREETGVSPEVYMEQLYTFGAVKRDPRGRVISVVYMALIAEPEKLQLSAEDDAAEAQWWPMNDLPPLSFGASHLEILQYAQERLRAKFEYTNVALSMLPKKFTLSELQRLYEAVYDRSIDKRNFCKKILLLKMLKPLNEMKREFGRPAQIYQALSKELKNYQKIV